MKTRPMIGLGRRLSVRRPKSDDGVAMVIALLLMMVIFALTVTLVSTLVAQPPAIFLAQRRTQTVYASQAGLQVAVGQLRNTPVFTSGPYNTYPIPADLPCSVSGTADGSSSYSATITYYNANPAGQTLSWLSSAANQVSCTAGAGTNTTTPSYALIRSSGSGAAVPALGSTGGVRVVQAIYAFKVTNVNIPGGEILDSGQANCMKATAAAVTPTVTMVPIASCTSPTLDFWFYNTSYQLQLASTIASGSPLCLQGGTAGSNVTLALCSSVTTQKWGWSGLYTWSQSSYSSGICLNSLGLVVTVVNTCPNGQFYPTPAIGPGAAGPGTHQLVNYLQFGRCADATNQVTYNNPYIAYPCKQDPTQPVDWNQQWAYTEAPGVTTPSPTNVVTTTIQTTDNYGVLDCLTTPATGTALPAYTGSSAFGQSNDPYFIACTGQSNQKWTRVGNTGDWASSYLMEDNWGHCLDIDQVHTYAGWSEDVISTCNGGNSQKWNAIAQAGGGTLGSFQQVTG